MIYHLLLYFIHMEKQFKNPLISIFGWWYLLVAFSLSMLVFCMKKVNMFASVKRVRFLFVFDLFLCAINLILKWPYDGYYIIYLHVLPFAFLFYLLGVLVKNKYNRLELGTGETVVLSIIFGGTTFLLSHINTPVTMYNNSYGNVCYFTATALLGSASVLLLSKKVNSNILRWCGVNSIVIYVLQFHVNIVISFICRKVMFMYNKWLQSFVTVVISLVVVLLLSFFCRKYLWFLFGVEKPIKKK